MQVTPAAWERDFCPACLACAHSLQARERHCHCFSVCFPDIESCARVRQSQATARTARMQQGTPQPKNFTCPLFSPLQKEGSCQHKTCHVMEFVWEAETTEEGYFQCARARRAAPACCCLCARLQAYRQAVYMPCMPCHVHACTKRDVQKVEVSGSCPSQNMPKQFPACFM